MKTENFRKPALEDLEPFAKVVVDHKALRNLDLPVERQWLLGEVHPFILKTFEYYINQSIRVYNAGRTDQGLYFSIDHEYGEVFRMTACHTPREYRTDLEGVWFPAADSVFDFPPAASSASTSFASVMQHALKSLEQADLDDGVENVRYEGTYVEFVESLYSKITSVWRWNDAQWIITYKPAYVIASPGYERLVGKLEDVQSFNPDIWTTRGREGVGIDRSAYFFDYAKDELLFIVQEDETPNVLQAYVRSQHDGAASMVRQWATAEDLRGVISKILLELGEDYSIYHVLDVPDQDDVIVKLYYHGDVASAYYVRIKR